MKFEMPAIIKSLVGLDCCEARVGYADALVLGFGEKMYDNPRRANEFHGAWQLRTESFAWRIIKNTEFCCGCYGDNEENDSFLTQLLSLRIENVIAPSRFDIDIVLESGYRINLFAQSRDTSCFGILGTNNIYIEFDSINGWNISKSDISRGLSKEESILDEHSRLCFERWEKTIPRYQGELHCSRCVYFRPLRGEFYFWDYGICSNIKSEFDGELVGVKSGCSNFSCSFNMLST